MKRHHSAKLTVPQVRSIKKALAQTSPAKKVSKNALAKKHGVTWGAVDAIERGETWKHV